MDSSRTLSVSELSRVSSILEGRCEALRRENYALRGDSANNVNEGLAAAATHRKGSMVGERDKVPGWTAESWLSSLDLMPKLGEALLASASAAPDLSEADRQDEISGSFNGEDCVQLNATVESGGVCGKLASRLDAEEVAAGALQDDRQYTVQLDSCEHIQLPGSELHIVESAGISSKDWFKLHGQTGKLKFKPVTVTGADGSKVRGLLEEEGIAFRRNKYSEGLELEGDGRQYAVKVGGEDRKVAAAAISYCGEDFTGIEYAIELHELDPQAHGPKEVVSVPGRNLLWHDSVFRAELTLPEVIGLRLYTGTLWIVLMIRIVVCMPCFL